MKLPERISKKLILASNGCIEWRGYVHPRGYGMAWLKKSWQIHRLVWTLHKGSIPKGMVICHKCDNRTCANIDHLFIGTIADNNKDRDLKNRNAKGSRIGISKLSDSEVKEIRRLFNLGFRQADIVKKYGLDFSTVSAIFHRRTWKHI